MAILSFELVVYSYTYVSSLHTKTFLGLPCNCLVGYGASFHTFRRIAQVMRHVNREIVTTGYKGWKTCSATIHSSITRRYQEHLPLMPCQTSSPAQTVRPQLIFPDPLFQNPGWGLRHENYQKTTRPSSCAIRTTRSSTPFQHPRMDEQN